METETETGKVEEKRRALPCCGLLVIGDASRHRCNGKVKYEYVTLAQHKKAKKVGWRRSERIMLQNPEKCVRYITPAKHPEPIQQKEPNQKRKIIVPPEEFLPPGSLREMMYPTKPAPPPLSEEERKKIRQQVFSNQKPLIIQELFANQMPLPSSNATEESVYTPTPAPTRPPPPSWPLLYTINDATAAIAGWTPRAELPEPVPELTSEEFMKKFRELQQR